MPNDHESRADRGRGRDRGVGWARPAFPVLLTLGLGAVLTFRAGFTYHGARTFMLFDDAMISMRFARNLADGHGLVFNAGRAPVEGYTNFLWTLWMAFLHLLPVPVRFVSALVSASGALLVATTVVLVGRIARLLAPPEPARSRVVALAMWGVALWYPLLWWSVRGLETGLLSALLAAAVLLALRIDAGDATRDTIARLAVVLGAGVLTRTDFVVLAAGVIAWLAWRRGVARRTAAVLTASVVAVLAAHTAFRLVYYGEIVPNTYVLKIEGISLTTRIDRGASALGALLVAELAIAVGLTVITVMRRRRERHVWLLVIPVLSAAAYSVYVGADAWEYTEFANRYLAPVGPLLFVLAALGVAEVVGLEARRRQATIGALAGIVALAIIAANLLDVGGGGIRVRYNLAPMQRAHWIALACALGLLAAAFVAAGRRTDNRVLVFGALGAALVVLVALPSWMEWRRTGGELVISSKVEAREGLALRDAVRPGSDPSVAVVAAGNIPYWSMLPTVDVLGKVDPVIAHRPPQPVPFHPGHDKWDYRYSICTLRPDVVVQLYEPTVEEIRMIERCGYHNTVALDRHGDVVTYYLLRDDQTGFDPDRLRRALFGDRAAVTPVPSR